MELTEKQMYAHWACINEAVWCINNNQVISALKVLKWGIADMKINVIPFQKEDGISMIAFAFREVLDEYGDKIEEIAIDLTCK
jgi:hypothetical protein